MPKKAKEEEVATGAVRFGRVRNNLKMGIVGLPNVGKSSLFNLLTKQSVAAENFPFCTIDPNEARCAVPDARYEKLVGMWKPVNEYPAYLQVTDIAGLVKGAAEGAGLGNAFLSHIQAIDGIFHVIRAFESEDIIHVDDSVDPVRDLATIQHELCLKDLEALKRAMTDEEKDVKRSPGFKLSAIYVATMKKVQEMLEEDKPVRDGEWVTPEVDLIKLKLDNLITTKPVVYLVNMSKSDFIAKKNKHLAKIHKWIQEHGGGLMVPFSIEFEEELYAMREDAAAQEAFLAASTQKSALPKMITQGYTELGMIYYFTAGEKEVRCWTLLAGSLAPQAAGVIHSDFERGFIKAEVVGWEDFNTIAKDKKTGMTEVKAAGKYRQEGKQYVVKDGDIIHFQFNVTNKGK